MAKCSFAIRGGKKVREWASLTLNPNGKRIAYFDQDMPTLYYNLKHA